MDAEAEIVRAAALLEVRRPDEAARLLTRVLAQRPDSSYAWCLLARCHDVAERPAEMLAASARAIEVRPDDEWAHRLHAHALTALGRPRPAVASAAEAARLAPQEWRTHYTLAGALRQTKRYREAWPAAAYARRLAPDQPDVHALCGDLLDDMGDTAAARAAYETALRLAPDHDVARHNLAVLEFNRGRPTVAAGGFGAVVAADPTRRLFADNAARAARGVLWRLADWAGLVLVVAAVVRATLGLPAAAAAGTLALAGYGFGARRILRATPAGVRAEMRHRIWNPTYGLAVLGAGLMLLGAANAAYLPEHPAVTPLLAIGGLAFLVVVAFRVRNRLLLVLLRSLRRLWYRVGRVPPR